MASKTFTTGKMTRDILETFSSFFRTNYCIMAYIILANYEVLAKGVTRFEKNMDKNTNCYNVGIWSDGTSYRICI